MGELRNATHCSWKVQARPKRRWKDNIKMDLTEIGMEAMDWIHVAQDREQWRAHVTVMILRIP
jgi:hypothetical protein